MSYKYFCRGCALGIVSILGIVCSGSVAHTADPQSGRTDAQVLSYNWGAVVAGYQLAAAVSNETFSGDEPVLIHVGVKNTTDHILALPNHYPHEKDFLLTVTDASGQSIPLTRFGHFVSTPTSERRVLAMSLGPHTEQDFVLNVSRMYDITMAGTYYLTVRHHVWVRNRSIAAEASSSTLKVTVEL